MVSPSPACTAVAERQIGGTLLVAMHLTDEVAFMTFPPITGFSYVTSLNTAETANYLLFPTYKPVK